MTDETIFATALEKADPAERAAFLDEACRGDTEHRKRLEELLAAHAGASHFLERPAAGPDSGDTRTLGHEAGPPEGEDEPFAFLLPSTRPDSLGRIGHYEVLEVLGRGGFGIVFRAFDDMLQRVVAVKVLSPHMAATSPARKRFLREARSSAQVRHENVVQVYEVGEQPLPYIAMEFIPGETLQQRLDRTGPLEEAEVVRIGRQIAEGLAAAHATDLIHRDIKPGNVLLEGGSLRVKITDFGLARAADDASLSHSGIIAGTPMYMAPEQARGETLDQRADLFSLGSVLYQIAAGRPPFRANGMLAVLKRVAEDAPRPIREVIPETPQWLCDIIVKLHAKNPDERYQSAREVADVLADCEAQLKAKSRLEDFSRIPRSKSVAGRPGRWKWVAAAALLLPLLALAVTEIAGVTHLLRGRAAIDSIQPGGAAETADVPPSGKPPSTATTDPDRRAAEGVLSIGGWVKVNEQEQTINSITDLPREPFRLTYVNVRGRNLTDNGLACCKGCKNLVHLELSTNDIDFQGVLTDEGLAYFKDCKNLTSLSLNSAGFTDAGLAYFKDCKNLTSLYLGSTGVTDAGLLHFKECKNLTSLTLHCTRITDAGLAHFKGCENLTDLNLYTTPVGDAGMTTFADCKSLKKLNLSNTRVTDAGVAHVKGCENLTDVNLYGTTVGDAGIAALTDCKSLKNLNLGRTQVGGVGLARLEDCKGLRVLDLGGSEITDAGLASVKKLEGLTNLRLDATPVSDAGLAFLAALDNLTELYLFQTKVTGRGVKGLAKALPNCTIAWDGGVIEPNGGSDRRAAEYVLSVGGVVEINRDSEITALVKLPKHGFRLTRVGLGNNSEVTDAGLAAFKDCRNLKVIDLTGTPVTDVGLAHLAGLSDLTNLLLAKTRVTAKGVEGLAKARPKCKITWDGGVSEAR